jgi:hypothetical protein
LSAAFADSAGHNQQALSRAADSAVRSSHNANPHTKKSFPHPETVRSLARL